MNKVANTYWVDNRLQAQRVTERAIPSFTPARDLSRDLIGTRTEIRRRGGVIPSWVVFGMIILATFAICVTVTMRTHAEMRTAIEQHSEISAEVQTLRSNNAALETEVRRLRTDPRAVEAAARTRLNMVRANEIVVPAE
ncbi:MAG TPA: septum formation initiator family protein [Pyrinomonadaceae bacterium]|nr:septum formation initiator family protein [Pyrinomonadaceae bacterium]